MKSEPEPKATQVAHLAAFSRRQGDRELRVTLEEWSDAPGRHQIAARNFQRDPTGVFETRSRSGCLVYPHEIPRLIAALKRAQEIINAPQGEPQ